MLANHNGQSSGPVPPPKKRLGTKEDVGQICSFAARTVLRNADRGVMPWGIKIGALRRWDLDEIEAWIAAGCRPVRNLSKGGA